MMLAVMVMIMAMSLNVQMLNIDLGKVGIASGTGEWEYASHVIIILVKEDTIRHLRQYQTKNKYHS